MPSIVRLEYKWDEIKDPVFKETAKIDNVDAIKSDLSEMGITESVAFDFDKASYDYGQLGGTTTRSVKGIAASTADGSTDRIMCRGEGVNGTGAIKWATSPGQETAVIFGKNNAVANGLGAAYELQPNRKYTVTYYIATSTANITFGIKGLSTYVKAEVGEGYTLASHTVASKISSYTAYTDTFTTPDAATMGDNKYLSFFVNKGSNSTVTVLLDNVTVSAEILPSMSELVTFNDNGRLYYANASKLTFLPDGNNGSNGCEFEGWVGADGFKVYDIPENGTVLSSRYLDADGASSIEKSAVTLTFDKLLTYKNISGNANGVSGIISASAASICSYSRSFGGNYAVKVNGKNTIPQVGLYLARDDNAYTGDQFGYILTPNTKYTVSFDECVSELSAGTTVTYQLMAVRSSSSAVIADGIKLGESINVTAKGEIYTNHTVEFAMPSIAEMGKNAKLQIVLTCSGTTDTYSYSSFIDNVTITKINTNKHDNFFMQRFGSIRYEEAATADTPYVSAGLRFKARVFNDYRGKASEVGFVVVPNAALYGMAVEDYLKLSDNVAKIGKVKADGMTEIIYDVGTDSDGRKYCDYQMILTGLTGEGKDTNLLSTDMTVVMYAVVDGKKVYTDPITLSFDDVRILTEIQ